MSSIPSLPGALPAVTEPSALGRQALPGASRPESEAVPLPRGLRRDSAVISPEGRALLEREQTAGLPAT